MPLAAFSSLFRAARTVGIVPGMEVVAILAGLTLRLATIRSASPVSLARHEGGEELTETCKWCRISLQILETGSEMACPTPSLTRLITMRFLLWRAGLGVTAKKILRLSL